MTQELDTIIAKQRHEIETLKLSIQEQNTKIMALQSQVQSVTRAGEHAAKRADEVIAHLHHCLNEVAKFGDQIISEYIENEESAEKYRESLQAKLPARVG